MNWRQLSCLMALAIAICTAQLSAQGIQENFDTVAGDPPTTVLNGAGFNQVNDWDSGIAGESAFAGTSGNLTGLVEAFGLPAGGVAASGAGAIDFMIDSFNVLDLDFDNVAATGTTEIIAGGAGPGTFNFIDGWDANIDNEFAFGGTSAGATLNGNMSVTPALAGGNPGGQVSLDVNDVTVPMGESWFAGLQFDVDAFPGATALANGGFEDSPIGPAPSGWGSFGFGVNTTDVTPLTGAQCLALFESVQFAGAGITQRLPAIAGQTWEFDGFVRTNTGDSIVGTDNFVLFAIEYFDANGATLDVLEAQQINGNSVPAPVEDTWIDGPGIQLLAPANTAEIEVRVIYVNISGDAIGPGAVLVDDLSLNLISGPQPVQPSNFELLADISGLADVAGETLGNVQLRIEDADGDRIQFDALTTNAFQTIGGPLDTGTEADSMGVPTPGAFNILSPFFRVVVAFGDDGSWGTGGTINVDNVTLTNANPAGSNLNAGLLFQNLALTSLLPEEITLTADVLGDVLGGEYRLVLRAFDNFFVGLDEGFESVIDTTEVVFLDTATIIALEPNAVSSTLGWSPDIEGEEAFGGVVGLVDTASFSPRIYANAVDGLTPGGCQSSTRAGQIGVESISTQGAWFAGLSWPGQRLASADLSQVELTACVRGLEDPSDPFMVGPGMGFLGSYELRIEDADGDRLFFAATANGSWQSIGGTLDTATFGAAFDGGSNGVFDINLADPDSLPYTVVLAFEDGAQGTWFSGGILQIDDLFLTPVNASVEVAEFAFDGTADGASFQSIGGTLDTATGPAFGNFDQDMENGTGTPGRINLGGNDGDFDDGLEGENMFFGSFGAAIIDGAEAVVCATCGVGGGQAIELTVTNNPPNGWFAGVFFEGVALDLSGDLSQIELRGDIKGEINGGINGTYTLRIEDAETDSLEFTVTADGTFQAVGGTLDTATQGFADPGQQNGIFNFFQPTYNVTVAFVGLADNWGPGGKLTIDNLFVTGRDLSGVDEYEVALEFVNPVSTFPGGGMLVLDNLNLADGVVVPVTPGDVNCDGAIDGRDIAAFVTATVDPAGYDAAFPSCNILNADTDSSGTADTADIASFAALLLSQ